ncbi:MAG: insulinase family protein [Paludibacteraceae bacterium]|nr:insulinase family protein [Paludibacteraceae bacterium]
MKKGLLFAMCVLLAGELMAQNREGLTEYKLENGLTVMLWENHDQNDVEGYVAVRAGAIDEPAECTGLAHYLEHMMFKGTDKIGAIDWEKEKPYYEEIIRLYDEYAAATDKVQRDTLTARINRASLEAAKYSTTEDFFSMLDGIGATGVNAFTSYDMTCYHNSFPANQMYKWLTIFSDRLINPVFRTFQAELENVFEEYNMYEDNVNMQVSNKMFEELYKGHPYERNVIGLPEHLKNPQLSKLIEFYNTWYVANNMALIIVGDFDTEATKPMIEETFGRLKPAELPARKTYPNAQFQGGKKLSYKLGYYPEIVWAWDGVKVGDEDALALQFVCSLLANSMSTGLLDKISMDGIVSDAGCGLDARRDMGRILVYAVPYYDMNQQQFESNAATEKIIFKEIEKLQNGDIPDWLIESVKTEYVQNTILGYEEGEENMMSLVDCFIYNEPTENIFTNMEKGLALTKEDVQRIAKKYFSAPHLTISFDEGDKKVNKLDKPKIKPLDMPKGVETEYAKNFKALPAGDVIQTYTDYSDVQKVSMGDKIDLYYNKNEKNDIFSLTLRYGIGTMRRPLLEYVAQMMNVAGIKGMPAIEPQDFRRQLSEKGGRVFYGVSKNYFEVTIFGDEKHLADICQLVQRQMLFPKFDQQQFESMQGSELSNRFRLDKIDDVQADALEEYVLFGDKSDYKDVVPFMDIYYMDELKLMTEFLDATKYKLDIFYCGAKPLDEAKTILAGNLPLQEGMQDTKSPEYRDRKSYDKTQIYFLANSNVQQATIYFYFNSIPYDKDKAYLYNAFNQYFDGGFSGIVMDEIRTKRSFAYTATGYMAKGELPGRDSYFMGYIGTQSDKVADAVETFMHICDSMPIHPERMENVRAALLQEIQISKPSFRSKAEQLERLNMLGYTEDPAIQLVEQVKNMTFEDIEKFYKENIQGKPMTIIIMGDPKKIDQKRLAAKFGKIQKVSKSKLFAPLDLDF